MVNATGYDTKVQKLLEECKISAKLINYMENFDYPYVSDVQTFYESLLKIGQGTFGEVFKARCKRTGQFVALKKILMENEKEGFPITALREIKMLKLLRHPNITELIEVCTCKQRNARERFSFYLVFTFCEHDLAGLLSNQKVKFSLTETKTMAKHILEGLNKIHKSGILHRDMKSANVLITSDGILKLADFGLARLMIKQSEHRYTNRVVTLWYRPPELLLGSSQYGPSIDVWGAGCIISELWIRSPILQGNTEQEQLIRIAKLCGSINSQTWPGCEKLPLYGKLKASSSQTAYEVLPDNYPRRVRERIFPFLQQNEQALALIDQMLSLCPSARPTADGALDHNFFWSQPLPTPNIKELVDKLKGTNLFEYTSNCGAHANRKQRPIAPAAPRPAAPSNGGGNNQNAIQQHRRQPIHLQHQQQQHGQQIRTHNGVQQQQLPISGGLPKPDGRTVQQQNIAITQPQISRKRPGTTMSGDDFNQPPARRPTPLAQASTGRPQIGGTNGIWMHPQRNDGSINFENGASFDTPVQPWQAQFHQSARSAAQPFSAPRQAWPPQAHQTQQFMPRILVPPPQQQQANRYSTPNQGHVQQHNYSRQPPPSDTHFFR